MKNRLFFTVLLMVVLAISIVAVGCASISSPADAADIPPTGQENLLRGVWTTGEKTVAFDSDERLFSTVSGISPTGTFRYSYRDSVLTLGIKSGVVGYTKKDGSATLSADGNKLTLIFGSGYAVLDGQYTKQ
jgi:hypothetical protein